MKDGRLAVVMPTYRFDAKARHCIETVAGMASEEVEVYIGDNSCDPRKWALLRKLGDRSPFCHVYCHETNLGGGANLVFLMDQQQHEYVCMVSDDDMYSPDYFLAGLEELTSNPACAVASGLCLVMTPHGDRPTVQMPSSNLGTTPVERIAHYVGVNTIPYGVYRRKAGAGYRAFMRDRPFFPSYMDQFLTYALLAQGTYVIHPHRQMFVYNNDNWRDGQTGAATDTSYYVAAGLPAGFVHLHKMCWSVEIVLFFNSIYRPDGLSAAEAQAIVKTLYTRHFTSEFCAHVMANLPAIADLFAHAPEAILTLKALMETPCEDAARVIALFVEILRVFDADLADRYARFADRSLRPITQAARLAG